MRAVQIHSHGGIDQLCYEEAADPSLTSPDDAIVKLHAASLNPSDIGIRQGATRVKINFPHILGSDGAGTVISVGARVKNVKPGDPVALYPASGCGDCELCATDREFMCPGVRLLGERNQGTYAQHVRVAARNCFVLPAGLSFEEAAAMPVCYISVWRMLVTHAEIRPGETLLIRGFGSAMATAALQVGTAIGAHILVAGNSDDELASAIRLGAEFVIDERAGDVAQHVRKFTAKRGVDVVVDCVGGTGWAASLASLSKGGRLVTSGATAGLHPQTDLRRIFWNHLKIFGSTLGTRQEFRDVLNFMKLSGTRPIIDRVFSLEQAAEAQQRMAEQKQTGKVILRMEG